MRYTMEYLICHLYFLEARLDTEKIRLLMGYLTLNDCSPPDQTLSDLLYSKTKQKQNLKTALRFKRSRATAVNIELFPV